MARTLPVSVVEAVNAQTTGSAFLSLLTIEHPDWDTVRLVNDITDLTFDSNTYTAFPFAISLPPDTEELQPRMRVAVQNAERTLVDEMRAIAGNRTRATATLEVVESDSSGTVTSVATWSQFELVNVQYNVDVLTFDLVIETFISEGFPKDSFAPSTFPGVF